MCDKRGGNEIYACSKLTVDFDSSVLAALGADRWRAASYYRRRLQGGGVLLLCSDAKKVAVLTKFM